VGIDEAGLGPILGPYCAAAAGLRYEGETGDPRELCPEILSSEPRKGSLAVGDSKAVYSPGKEEPLERTVLAFYRWFTEEEPTDALSFFKSLIPGNRFALPDGIPWYEHLADLKLPVSLDSPPDAETAVLIREMSRAGIKPGLLGLNVQPARAFNRLLIKTGNKSSACQLILNPLLLASAERGEEIIVDRQGGRRYYGDWLIELFPGAPLRALRETKELSRYEAGEIHIEFRVKADALCFETALASMFAKYSRELCMKAFNGYWQKRSPGLKRTAGYYSDGQRFIRELKELRLYPEDPDMILRRK
jgi:hypothetical protein